ncbi:choline transporter-like protein 1 isoform X1 [Mya arenaria]|uniref:choline transporter-like protein 1 isoform X1 n=1 Tax=Mya arenaria TaxID=6604 RepID=UPI0022E6EAD2|nr:choline transporter-like protein 1 isoform X1 [Mya arenaria]XP_052775736.1 choline transporter-like protein 1 isoform X1 [Mya arenaria]XP_052775737.1 choline transporter-like protein 1 isoform X1 [Mya arenaria]XP_052775738.1 choline transporter-like protein 1 isoform X1 [Mya arenaria]XP_052775739.1 choline transporter-like protein 1 isoform X1 [Mya arenaria]
MCGCCGDDKSEDKADLAHPVKNRGCTDIIVLLLFIAFWAGMIFIAAFGIVNGDAFRLVFGYDSFGNTCDSDNSDKKIENVSLSGFNTKGRPYVFFMDVSNPFKSKAICVNKCPDNDQQTLGDVELFSQQTGSELCEYDIPVGEYHLQTQSARGPCPLTPLNASHPVLNRCIPVNLLATAADVSANIVKFLNASDLFQKVLSDLYKSWKQMIILCFIAIAFSGIMVLLIRFLASFIVWIILAVAIVGSIAGTAFLWWTYVDMKTELDKEEAINLPLLDVEINSERAFLVYSIIATVLTVILLLIILVMRKRISLVVALFHEAGRCISAMPCLLLQPVWTFICLLAFFMYWVIVLAFLSTSEKRSVNAEGYIEYTEHETVSYMWWYHLIGLIWTSEFIIACQQLVVCGSVATWYFARDKSSLGCPIGDAIRLLICHHLGSVAFGALVITLVKLPRMILMWLHKKLKNSENKCGEYCMKCCICCLWCLEKCLKYLNQNAYTIVAIEGKNFCQSAAKSFTTLVNNALRVAAINSVGDFVLFLGKIGVMAATAAVGLLWFKSRSDLHYYAIPVLLVCVFSYLIASSCLSTYEMVIDAMLLCFCHDCDINDNSPEGLYAGDSLMDFVDGTSKELNANRLKNISEEEAEPAEV